ncbi:hypothetical protein Tsp_12408 [Trichinella spiralis]|uniref:hypothetical protein n=1 Tax=Trichinella spiralis TaxID=6334 RepID=UPI0001EFDE4F|nr:hypothetical protein Tsp_12408 [Trichinella spiralis]
MKLASLFQKVAEPSGARDPDDHAVLDNVFVDFTLARPQAALFGTAMFNGRNALPRTDPEERNAELETIKIAHVQQNSTDSCHPAITSSVKVVDEGPQRDSCIMAISIKRFCAELKFVQ